MFHWRSLIWLMHFQEETRRVCALRKGVGGNPMQSSMSQADLINLRDKMRLEREQCNHLLHRARCGPIFLQMQQIIGSHGPTGGRNV